MTSITQQGIASTSSFAESFLNPYDLETYTEPDGSAWIKIIHHNNPTNAKFASTNTFTTSVYLDTDRWFYGSLFNQITNEKYELMLKQKTTSSATEAKYRWIQTVNPMTATYDQTKAANVTKITTTGYSNIAAYGGVFLRNGNTWLAVNDGSSSGDWMGALGCWAAWNGGIPGWGGAVTSGYMDLYLRVDNQVLANASVFDTHIQATEFIEW